MLGRFCDGTLQYAVTNLESGTVQWLIGKGWRGVLWKTTVCGELESEVTRGKYYDDLSGQKPVGVKKLQDCIVPITNCIVDMERFLRFEHDKVVKMVAAYLADIRKPSTRVVVEANAKGGCVQQ